MPKKKSFFERLTGAINAEEDILLEENSTSVEGEKGNHEWMEEENGDAQLSVDVYQTPNEIVIRTMAAGVKPEDLDVSITREMVTVRGRREESREVEEDGYFHKELFWGGFSRSILLPEEVEAEEAEAEEHHGLLTIRLPKIDKERKTKLKIKSM